MTILSELLRDINAGALIFHSGDELKHILLGSSLRMFGSSAYQIPRHGPLFAQELL
jgi:hypothetical protein